MPGGVAWGPRSLLPVRRKERRVPGPGCLPWLSLHLGWVSSCQALQRVHLRGQELKTTWPWSSGGRLGPTPRPLSSSKFPEPLAAFVSQVVMQGVRLLPPDWSVCLAEASAHPPCAVAAPPWSALTGPWWAVRLCPTSGLSCLGPLPSCVCGVVP